MNLAPFEVLRRASWECELELHVPVPAPHVFAHPATLLSPVGAPPSYEQIFGVGRMREQMKEARNTSSNQGTFAVKFCKILCGSAACLVCLLILAALPVTMIVIGAVYFNDCPGISNLNAWLIVFGSFSLLQTVMNIVRRCLFRKKDSGDENSDKNYGSYCFGSLEGLITIFLFVWIIVGSVWVFRYYDTWRNFEMCRDPSINPMPPCLCHPVPYLFSFITLIVIYSISGLFCLCCCCFFCCAALAAGD